MATNLSNQSSEVKIKDLFKIIFFKTLQPEHLEDLVISFMEPFPFLQSPDKVNKIPFKC